MSTRKFCNKMRCLLTSIFLIHCSVVNAEEVHRQRMLNFNANIVRATCDIELSNNTLQLQSVNIEELKKNRLMSLKSFILSVKNCKGVGESESAAYVKIRGSGSSNDGKWLFRDGNSTPGVGVLLYKSESQPEYYSKSITNDEDIKISDVNGATGDLVSFWAGLSCGDCKIVSGGDVKSTLYFEFVYK